MTKAFLFSMLLIPVLGLQAATVKKEYKKTFEKADLTEVVISNQKGQIDVEQKEDGGISVEAEINVTAKSGAKADELMEFITIEDTQKGSFLNVETAIGKNTTFKELLAGVEISVNYKVVVPAGLKLRLINREGNVYVERFSGDLVVDIKSGNFHGGTLKDGELQINQSDGDLGIDYVAKMNGQLKGCHVRIEDAGDMKLAPENCEGTLNSVINLDMAARNGSLRLGQIEQLTGSANSTKFEIEDIGDVLKMDMKYGEINVRNIHFNFSNVEVKGSYTKVGLTFMAGAGYDLELRHNKALKRLDIPRNFKLTEQPTSEKNVVVKTGFVGSKKYHGKVLVDIRSGNLYIQ